MESASYPFFGTQFHPEKVLDQFNDDVGLNHSWESVLLNRNLADTFVQLARENKLNPGTYEKVMGEDIANFDLIVTDYYYGEVYVFPWAIISKQTIKALIEIKYEDLHKDEL